MRNTKGAFDRESKLQYDHTIITKNNWKPVLTIKLKSRNQSNEVIQHNSQCRGYQ